MFLALPYSLLSRSVQFCIVSLLLLLGSLSAQAQTNTWTGGTDTDWNTAANWSLTLVPEATHDVVIPSAPANQPILSTTATVKSVAVASSATLTINNTGSLDINGATGFALTNRGTLDNSGTIRIGNLSAVADRGIVHYSGTLYNRPGGLIQIDRTSAVEAFYSEGVVNNEATIEIGTNAAVTGNGISIVGSTFTNSATITINGSTGKGLSIAGGVSFTNNSASTLTINGSTGFALENRGTLDNSGTIRIGNTSAVADRGIVHYSGTLYNRPGGFIQIDRTSAVEAFYSEGVVNNEAIIEIGTNAPVTGNGFTIVGGTFTNSATITIGTNVTGTAIRNQSGAIFTNLGEGSGCQAQIQGLILSLGNGVISNSSPASFSNTGTIIENSTGTSAITFNGGVVQNNNGGTFNITTNLGLLTTGAVWTGCVSRDWNTPANWSGKIIPTTTDDAIIASAPANQPIISTTATAKTVEVQSGASLSISSAGSLTINGNKTTFIPVRTGGFSAIIRFYNIGTVINEGAIVMGNLASTTYGFGFANTGTFSNRANGSITIDRSNLYHGNGSFVNAGTILLGTQSRGGLTNNASFSNTAGGYIASGDVSNQAGSTFVNSSTLTIGVSATVLNNSLFNSGSFTNTTGGFIVIDRSPAGLINSNAFPGDEGIFVNSGIITIGASVTGGSYGMLNTGTFSNTAGGSVSIERTTRGLLNYRGSFVNSATITLGPTVSGTAIENLSGATFDNKGCPALFQSLGNALVTNAGSFSNTGTLIENASGNSNISFNGGLIVNNNGGSFTVTSGNAAVSAGLVWQGCVSSDWNTAGNWYPATVPTATDNAIIQIGTVNQPIISTTATAKSVEVQTGASLSIASAGSLTINNSRGITRSGFTYATSFYNEGTVVSAGQLVLGNLAPVGVFAIWNNGTFTNNGGNISIDRTTNQGIDNGGTFANTGTITIGSLASVGTNGIWNQTIFNNTGGIITIDQTTSHGLHNTGRFTNSATLLVGQSGSIGNTALNNTSTASFTNTATGLIRLRVYISGWDGIDNYGTYLNSGTLTIGASASLINVAGLYSEASFTNTATGIIRVDQAPFGVYNYYNGVFTNAGTITLALSATAGQAGSGLQNYNRFTNQSTGVIYIDGYRGNGIWNTQDATTNFQNSGLIQIGANARTGITGILNYRTFSNNSGGQIEIDQPTGSAIVNNSPTAIFTNSATIRIGQNFAIPGSGINNSSSATFNNLAGASITIDRTGYGLTNLTSSTFVNVALIKISTTGPASTTDGLWNTSVFSNSTCAVLTVFDNLNNGGDFTNAGFFTVNTTKPHSNTGTLTNNGVIDYPQGNPIPNVINNDVIVVPFSLCGPSSSTAVQIGGANSFSVGTTWYTDAALTTAGGTYNQATNTFTPTSLSVGVNTLYFTTNDNTNNCTQTGAVSVTVNATPTLSLVASNSLNCAVSSATLSASASAGAGSLTYTFSGGSLLGSPSTNSTVTVNQAGSYSVLVTDANTCTATQSTSVASSTALPVASLVASGSINCVNSSVTLTASGGSSYTFANAGGTLGTPGSASTLVVNTPGTYSVTVGNTNGCTATQSTSVVSNTTTPTVSLGASNSLNCSVTSATLSAIATGFGSLTYTFTGGSLLGSPSTNAMVTVNQGGSYSVLVTAANGCTASQSTSVASNTVIPTVTITPGPSLTISSLQTATFTASGAASYHWSNLASTTAISVNVAGPYSVTGTTNGCSGTATVLLSVTSAVPIITTQPATASTVCEGTSVMVTVGVSGLVTGYQWLKGGSPVPGQTGLTLSLGNVQVSNGGVYSLSVTGPGGSTTSNGFTLTVNPTPTATIAFPNSVTVQGTGIPIVQIPSLIPPVVFQVSGGVLYERLIILDRVNGFEIRQVDSNTTGIFPINRLGLFTLTVTGAGGCKRIVQWVVQ